MTDGHSTPSDATAPADSQPPHSQTPMPNRRKGLPFSDTPEGVAFEQDLRAMVSSAAYMTKPSFSTNVKQYPDHLIPFVDKHMEYIGNHPSTDPQQYLANLRLITRIR